MDKLFRSLALANQKAAEEPAAPAPMMATRWAGARGGEARGRVGPQGRSEQTALKTSWTGQNIARVECF